MQIIDSTTIISASDLNNHLACRHLLAMNLAKAKGELPGSEYEPDQTADLLARKGIEHETKYLEELKESGLGVVEIPFPGDQSVAALEHSAEQTRAALSEGPDVVFQATFFDGESRGHADFLLRVDKPSDLGDFSYEVADTKLAKHSKPYFVVQLCFYSELLEQIQGVSPDEFHVVLGTGVKESFRFADFSAYYRRVVETFKADLKAEIPDSYPLPVEHCGICGWKDACRQTWEEDDHLSRVAGISRRQIELLEQAGIETLTALGSLAADSQVEGIGPETFTKIQDQAALQLEGKDLEAPIYRLLPPEGGCGLARLPEPSKGDIFFDFEGDPLFGDRGLEYLFGYVTADSDVPAFTALWGRDYAEEKDTFEKFIDFVVERRSEFPGSHVYHYASYEVSAIKRLAGVHATRELEVDQLLRDEVFVDLYKVVREGLRISQPSYSIKKVEEFYRDSRDTDVADGGESIVQFEKWLNTGEDSILEAIAAYNEDDCISTLECRDWLIERRAEAAEEFDFDFDWFEAGIAEMGEGAALQSEENAVLRASLTNDVPPDYDQRTSDQQARWLMAQLIDYHQREARPAWWRYFDRLDAPDDEFFIDDMDCVGALELDENVPPRREKQSMLYRMKFSEQETKMSTGACVDPRTEGSPGELFAIEPTEGWLDLKRGSSFAGKPFPRNLIPKGPIKTDDQREALRQLAGDIIENGLDSREKFAAGRDLLRAADPRIDGHDRETPIVRDSTDLVELADVVSRLDHSYLFVQGPPGAGKTFSASSVICDLVAAGKTVGVTALSHNAINNLLHATEKAATNKGIRFRGAKIGGPDSPFVSKLVDPMVMATKKAASDPAVQVTGATAWHFCKDEVGQVDYLFIDEAGQISLADALALSTAARNVVLLGDPQQLPQVTQACHPDRSGDSILEHLLGDHATIPCQLGVFLESTWRLAPEIASFISDIAYEGRLKSAPGREKQAITSDGPLSGSGLRWVPVESKGRSQSSPEEAEAVSALIRETLKRAPRFTDSEGKSHPLTPGDFLVLGAYNAQVKTLRDAVPAGVRVGTVDKFQGQQAQIVFFSMASSTAEDMPRTIDFLFGVNRLNVAISRAKCLAVLVANPKLLEANAKTVEQMRMINAPCLFVERADPEQRGGLCG